MSETPKENETPIAAESDEDILDSESSVADESLEHEERVGADIYKDEGTAEDEVAALKSELAVMRDKAMRAVAEAENVRRRADKERADTLKYAASGLAKELLPGIDNLRRAVESVPADQVEVDEGLKGLLVGVEMTERMLLDAFAKSGIEQLDPLDAKFDHSSHQAIQKVPNTGKPAGTIVQVLQPGYKLHDRLLRPATVIVAEGAAPPPPEETGTVDTTA